MRVISSDIRPLRPTTSLFYVDSLNFSGKLDIDAIEGIPEDRLVDWPMVYILTNHKDAYVGQTTSIARRMAQHAENPDKQKFDTVNVIYNEEANQSMITDYEHRLIELMSADNVFSLTNGNAGLSDSNYFSKKEYDEMFDDLWDELRRMQLAQHSIAEIEESDLFKYSPFKALNADQKIAYEDILERIKDAMASDEEPAPIIIQGMPGTGKTVLAAFLLKALKDDPDFEKLSIKFLEPLPSLRETVKSSISNIRNIDKQDIIGPSDLGKVLSGVAEKGKGKIDILLVDEAHKLKRRKNLPNYGAFDKTNDYFGFEKGKGTQLDWVLARAKLPILFYDSLQVIGPSALTSQMMKDRLGYSLEHPITLDTQMRVKAGKDYLNYISDILAGKCSEARSFDDYEFVLHSDFREFYSSFEKKLSQHSLTRMAAGYDWPWKTKGSHNYDEYDYEIEGIPLRWNSQPKNWVGAGINDERVAREVGSIHTLQGYDLSYCYVIVGPALALDTSTGKPSVVPSNYYDANGKKTATADELDQFIRNIYYVLMSRGIYGTHLYVCDPQLRDYFASFVEMQKTYSLLSFDDIALCLPEMSLLPIGTSKSMLLLE